MRRRSARRLRGLLSLLVVLTTAAAGSAIAVSVPAPQARTGSEPPGAPGVTPPRCTVRVQPTPALEALLDSLTPGSVACLEPGVYGRRGARTDWAASGTPDAPVTVRGEGVRVHGFLNIAADHVVVDGLVFDGPTGPVDAKNRPSEEEVLVWVQGDHVTLRRCEVRNGLWRAGIYVTGEQVAVDACWVHDNGTWSEPDQEQTGGRADNIDHGVYWGVGSSGSLTNSILERNLAYGLQISGGAAQVHVANNTIVRNGAGGVIWAEDTDGSTLLNNIIAYNDGYAVNAHLLTGRDNVSRDNLAWHNSAGEWNDDGPLTTRRNTVADPLFVGPRDYRLSARSPAVDAGALEGAPAADLLGRPRPHGAAPDLGAVERPSC